jgi:addiction module RelB/DinJ family antitoxin
MYRILPPMALVLRTATIQARVFPPVKEASERVLSRIGLNMSEAMELFLRRVIVDERIPFELVALNTAQLDPAAGESDLPLAKVPNAQKKNSKTFLRGRTSSAFRSGKENKRRTI